MIKAIAFDCGNVIFSNSWNDENTDLCFDAIPKMVGITKEKGDEIFFKHWPEIRVSKESEDVFFKDLVSISERKISLKKLKKLYYSCITKRDAFKIVKRLHKRYPDLSLYTLNDEGKEWMDVRIKKFGLKKYFKDFITSGYVGYAKSGGEIIFKILLRKSSLKAKEIIFVDDKKRNIITAKQVGFNAILFKNKQQLEKELRKYGFDL